MFLCWSIESRHHTPYLLQQDGSGHTLRFDMESKTLRAVEASQKRTFAMLRLNMGSYIGDHHGVKSGRYGSEAKETIVEENARQ